MSIWEFTIVRTYAQAEKRLKAWPISMEERRRCLQIVQRLKPTVERLRHEELKQDQCPITTA